MIGSDSDRLLRRRILAASIIVNAIFIGATLGFYGLGRVYLGHRAWTIADCAYFVVMTITTVGVGELQGLDRVPGGRMFTVAVLLSGLGVALYFASALTTFFVEGTFSRARIRKKMTRLIENMTDHIIVCGVGTTGIHVVEELLATRWPFVAIDQDPTHLERVQALSPEVLPTILGDATEDTVLERAGIRRARGIVAALTDDKANLYIVVTARELNPNLKIIAKGVEMKAAEKLRHAGAHSVVNPAFIGGVRMVSEMIRPHVVEFLDQLLRDKDKNLRIEEVVVPDGSVLVGKPISEAQIRRHTNLLVVAIKGAPPPSGDGQFVYNPGPETLIASGMHLIVLGETDSVHKLRAAIDRGFQP
jgi:voltage-gated potassium channel